MSWNSRRVSASYHFWSLPHLAATTGHVVGWREVARNRGSVHSPRGQRCLGPLGVHLLCKLPPCGSAGLRVRKSSIGATRPRGDHPSPTLCSASCNFLPPSSSYRRISLFFLLLDSLRGVIRSSQVSGATCYVTPRGDHPSPAS